MLGRLANFALQLTGLSVALLPLAPAAERRYVSQASQMAAADLIPPFVEVAESRRLPRGLCRIVSVDRWKDGGLRDGTVLVVLLAPDGARIHLFFDNVVGRLCVGKGPKDPDAAFVKHGSELERELFVALCTTDATLEQRAILRAAVAHASASTEIAFCTRVVLPTDLAWDELDLLLLKNRKLKFLRLLDAKGVQDNRRRLELFIDRYAYLRATRDSEFVGPHETYWKGFYS